MATLTEHNMMMVSSGAASEAANFSVVNYAWALHAVTRDRASLCQTVPEVRVISSLLVLEFGRTRRGDAS